MKSIFVVSTVVGAVAPCAIAQAELDLSSLSADEILALQENLERERHRREMADLDQQIESLRQQRNILNRKVSGLPISPTVLPNELAAPELMLASFQVTEEAEAPGTVIAEETAPTSSDTQSPEAPATNPIDPNELQQRINAFCEEQANSEEEICSTPIMAAQPKFENAQAIQNALEGFCQQEIEGREDESICQVQRAATREGFLDKFGFGAGIAVGSNLSGDRVKSASVRRLEDGTVIAQIDESEEVSVRLLAEGHFLFRDVGVFEGYDKDSNFFSYVGDKLGDFASCGLFSLKTSQDSPFRRGCGPFVAVVTDENASVQEFGLGHMLSLGNPATNGEGRAFNLGYGIIVDPDSETRDTMLFEPDSLIIREQFEEAVLNDEISLTTKEETLALMIVFSTNFF